MPVNLVGSTWSELAQAARKAAGEISSSFQNMKPPSLIDSESWYHVPLQLPKG